MEIDNGSEPCRAMAAFQFELTMGVVFIHRLDATTQTKMVPIWLWKEVQVAKTLYTYVEMTYMQTCPLKPFPLLYSSNLP